MQPCPLHFQYSGYILDLPLRICLSCPFQFGDDHVFGTCYKKEQALQIDRLATTELFLAKESRFAENKVYLPAGGEINYVE